MRVYVAMLVLPAAFASALFGHTGAGRAADHEPAAATLEALIWLSGPESGDAGNGMVIDPDGSVFLAGSHGGLDLDRDGSIDAAADGIDAFFMKLDPAGAVQWIRSPSGPEFESASRIALDRAGGIYGVGALRGTVTLDDRSLQGTGRAASYLVRYDGKGRALWTRVVAGENTAFFRDVASDGAGNSYLAGDGQGDFTVQQGEAGTPASYESHRFLVSYDPDGVLRWIRPHAATPDWRFSLIEVGPNGDLFVAGSFGDAGVDFDGDGNVELPGRAGTHAFVARYDGEGTLRDAWPLTALGAVEDQGVSIGSITVAPNGDVVVTGVLLAPVDFDGDGAPDAEPRSGGQTSAFLARYSPQGALRWARSYTIDGAWDVAMDGEGFLLAGFYRGERDLNDDGVIDARDGLADTRDETRESEWVVLVLSEDGRVDHAIPAPGPGNDQARAVGFLPDRRAFYVAGFIQLTADFSGDRTDDEGYVRCDALGDIIIARYGLGPAPAPGSSGCSLTLAARERRQAEQWLVDLTWSGASGANVEIHRNGARVATTANDGTYSDAIGPRVAGTYVYEIFESDSRRCTARVEVVFRP